MFIVVAIVIFGIFVVLANTLFGSEGGLTSDIKGLFENATEQSELNVISASFYDEKVTFVSDEVDFTFDTESGTVTEYVGESKEVVIPHEIEGKEVKVIGKYAFANKGLTKISIPNTVTDIEAHALEYNSLNTVVLPDSVKSLGTWALWSSKIKYLDLGNSLEFIGNGALAWNGLLEINLPNSVKTIKRDALKGNGISTINIPESVVNLEPVQFANTSKLKEIKVPLKFKDDFESNNLHLIRQYFNHDTGSTVTKYFDISDITFYY